ncbi:PREDICTED: mast cell-expressed membrane protein 1 [Galeopterus variegatus]|uniref:Mast cell-expressed membrane protein 1 n=1 Tax=Galeopterus variegatus TaxID=482537 RepID=A0ABM0RDZ1_GALVR|nr:PREDICTED: mast cell-expressed membrane protein 1 [Galeopterus variegatus]
MNQQLRMEVKASKDKKWQSPTKNEGACDPDYENITLTFRNRDQPKGGHPPPTSQVPAQPRPPPDAALVPPWLHRAIMSLYILLALCFLFCIILSALVLVKNSQMSRELRGLKREFWNVSNSVIECQEEQRKGWNSIQEKINAVGQNVQTGHDTLKTLPGGALADLPCGQRIYLDAQHRTGSRFGGTMDVT